MKQQWTVREINTLAKVYETRKNKILGNEFETKTNRTNKACYLMAHREKLTRETPRWSESDHSILVDYYPRLGAMVGALLSEERSVNSIYARAFLFDISHESDGRGPDDIQIEVDSLLAHGGY